MTSPSLGTSLMPDDRQTLFFSATLEGNVGKAARDYTHKARSHTHAPPEEQARDIEHRFMLVESQGAKLDETSMPRAATSVATSVITSPRSKRARAFSR